MITFEACQDMSGLTRDEVEVIAAHERLPVIVALELGARLAETVEGQARIRMMIEDDIAAAATRANHAEARRLEEILDRYCQTHPAA